MVHEHPNIFWDVPLDYSDHLVILVVGNCHFLRVTTLLGQAKMLMLLMVWHCRPHHHSLQVWWCDQLKYGRFMYPTLDCGCSDDRSMIRAERSRFSSPTGSSSERATDINVTAGRSDIKSQSHLGRPRRLWGIVPNPCSWNRWHHDFLLQNQRSSWILPT